MLVACLDVFYWCVYNAQYVVLGRSLNTKKPDGIKESSDSSATIEDEDNRSTIIRIVISGVISHCYLLLCMNYSTRSTPKIFLVLLDILGFVVSFNLTFMRLIYVVSIIPIVFKCIVSS